MWVLDPFLLLSLPWVFWGSPARRRVPVGGRQVWTHPHPSWLPACAFVQRVVLWHSCVWGALENLLMVEVVPVAEFLIPNGWQEGVTPQPPHRLLTGPPLTPALLILGPFLFQGGSSG